jgi:myo-inositol catabolism protein IolS
MKTRKLADTNIELSEITFGGASISGEGGGYGFGDISEIDSIKLLHSALDQGINTFDTAPIYGFGLSEQRMGKAFKDRRDSAFIISKSGVTWHENKRVDMTNRPDVAESMLHQSLRDLKTDYIDLYMVHWPDKNVDIRETLKVYTDAQKAGKIRFIGLCNTHLEDLNKAKEVCKIVMVQSQFHWFDRTPKTELFQYLTQNNISFMSWSTLNQGIISGTVNDKRKYDKSDARSWAPWWDKPEVARKVKIMDQLRPLLEKMNKNGVSLALSHNLLHPELTTALVGIRSEVQLQSMLMAYENRLNKDELSEVEKLYAQILSVDKNPSQQ